MWGPFEVLSYPDTGKRGGALTQRRSQGVWPGHGHPARPLTIIRWRERPDEKHQCSRLHTKKTRKTADYESQVSCMFRQGRGYKIQETHIRPLFILVSSLKIIITSPPRVGGWREGHI